MELDGRDVIAQIEQGEQAEGDEQEDAAAHR